MLTIEYDCPVDGIDYDLEVAATWKGLRGLRFVCIGCGRDHVLGVDVDANVHTEDGRFVRRFVRPGAQDD